MLTEYFKLEFKGLGLISGLGFRVNKWVDGTEMWWGHFLSPNRVVCVHYTMY